ncbi:centrosomal protein of 295 kDa isoform X10 [Mobula hypostoma]|uniref:centrosomal protein of 295 kDa isoform X10 n=1 Tax=Mobula hypostoma TaxID=723540 RepID=UPI002FC2D324
MRKMKRKVAKLSGFRLSPNEEALLIKEEHERRRRLRIKQVREQERFIAEQIREKVKQCRNQQLEQLANELKAEWQLAQGEKTKCLEKLYLSSLKAVGEGHRQAQENEPDLKIQSKQAAVNREKAEKRHREALRELKQQREKEHEVQTRYIKTRKKALLIEKKRAITIAHLPPPPTNPFADLEVPKYPTVKMYDIDSFSATHYHLPEPYVNREMNSKQVSARLTAEKEEKRLEELKQEAEMERQEQLEKARLRGSRALQLVHLMQDKEKLIKELEQMQLADLTHRRQAVSQMPQQLFEPPYRRVEINKDRQKEMEIAFEDMYADDKKIKGDVLLRLEPEPLPAPSVETQDEDLDLSVELEGFQEEQCAKGDQEESEIKHFRKTEVSPLIVTGQPSASPSKTALMKLLSKIRKQKDHCMTRSESNSVNEEVTINSGSITVEESKQTTLAESTSNANLSEEWPEVRSVLPDSNYQRETSEETIVAGNTTLFHPKEQANRIRSDVDRVKQLHDLEQQKQEQLALLWQSEHQKHDLEANLRISQLQQLQEATQLQERLISDSEKQTWQENEQLKHSKSIVSSEVSPEDEIHQYQQHLIEQNRLHKTIVEETRKQLNEYLLEKGLPSDSTSASCQVHSESKNHLDLLRSERRGFEVNGVKVLEPSLTILDAVESEQVLSHVGLMEDELKSIRTQPGTTEIAEERLKQSMCSIPLTKPIEILKNQERVSASSVDLSFQQEHLIGLQQQLWRQRQDLLATQKLQQEFICRQNQLMEQMQQQQYQGMEKKWTGNQVFPHYSKDSCFNAVEKTCEVDQTSTTTLSTGSFPLHEQTAPGPLNSAGDHQCTIDNIPSRQSTPTSPVCIWNLPPSFPEYQYTMKAQSNVFSTSEERSTSNESNIEKLIEKYTQDLSKLLDSGGKCQDSTTGCDISNLEFLNPFLQRHNCQQDSDFEFQPLECRPDFSINSSSLSLTSSKNSNFPSIGSTSGNQRSIPTATSDKESSSNTLASDITASDIDQPEDHIQQSYEENSSLDFFQPVHLEISPRQYNSNTDHSSENLEQECHNENSTNTEYVPSDLSRAGRVVADSLTVDSINQSSYSEPGIEKLRVGDGENSQEHADSFFQQNGTLTTVSEFEMPNQDEKWLEDCESKKQIVAFTKTINSDDKVTLESLCIEASKLMLSEEDNCVYSKLHQITEQNSMMQSKQLPHTKEGTDTVMEREGEFEPHWDRSQPSASNLMPGICQLGTLTPGTESDVGIMEEPELTQLTLNESTLLDDELGQEVAVEHITTENDLSEIQAPSQANGIQPVIPVNTSSESQKSEVIIFEFEPSAKILNEAVLKRKQKFLANSAKRVKDLKRKEKSGIVKSELYARPISHGQGQTSGFAASSSSSSSSSVATHLKMVGEVKVSTPEDRKAVEVEMRQRTLRLYSQLEEVKNKKREVNRQTVCARNREKAKEFQKRTLEKLRANRVRK